ncbi:MAG: peptidase family protein, partial [Ilumatobacteraceae bacterium]|nr:peptidase family protein [Ilumatobacteraceae bacterium]
DWFRIASNPPPELLVEEIRPHADFAVHQALAAPCIEIVHTAAVALGDGLWRLEVGIANTGWLPTTVSARAARANMVLPITARLDLPDGVEIIGGTNRVRLGQLAGRSSFRLDGGSRNDGTPDRVLATWTLRGPSSTAGFSVSVIAEHPRAGTRAATVSIE